MFQTAILTQFSETKLWRYFYQYKLQHSDYFNYITWTDNQTKQLAHSRGARNWRTDAVA